MIDPIPLIDPADRDAVRRQLGREPRGLRGVAHRCVCGLPDVVETAPRLEDGTPFPTLYYLTCPRAASAVGRLEAEGVMASMTARLITDDTLAQLHAAAHADYISRRDAVDVLPGDVSAGGMPTRVKCLHVLVAHELATGANPLGREALELLAADPRCDWGQAPCV